MIAGEVSLEEACMRVPQRRPRAGDVIRRTTVGLLRTAGFIVEHTPELSFPEHVSVAVPGEPERWHPEWRMRFEGAFITFEGAIREHE